jgi:NAD(P)-dependent dehydrogenase (short-subunit alcohol dehydrogenase family)
MQQKVCLITGATSGIGLATARELARRGARVVIVGRSSERCTLARDQVQAETGAPSVEYAVADLSSQAEVRRLAEEVPKRWPRIDVLINNAGMMAWNGRQESVDGIEMTWALNHLSYFLLTTLLLPVIKASAPARIISVASDAHWGASLNFADIEGKERFNAWWAYKQSKLANILFARELARRLEGSGITSNALHPGFVRTGFFRERSALASWVRLGARLFGIPPEAGARTSIYLATSPEAAAITGRYFVKEKPAKSSPQSQDNSAAERLWQLSEQMTASRDR